MRSRVWMVPACRMPVRATPCGCSPCTIGGGFLKPARSRHGTRPGKPWHAGPARRRLGPVCQGRTLRGRRKEAPWTRPNGYHQHYERSIRAERRTYSDLHQNPELSHPGTPHRRQRNALHESSASKRELGSGERVAAVLQNGDGPTVLLPPAGHGRAAPARTDRRSLRKQRHSRGPEAGTYVPVMRAYGHDIHVACLPGASRLLAEHRDQWRGTLVALLQPGRETGDRAAACSPTPSLTASRRLTSPSPSTCLPGLSGHVATRSSPGPFQRRQHPHHSPRPRRPRLGAAEHR